MKKTMMILAGLALTGLLAAGAWAGPWGGGPGVGACPGWGAGPGYGYPGPQLSQEDYAKLGEKRAAFLKETLPLRQKLAAKAVELRTLRLQANPDPAQLKALSDEVIELRTQIAKKANEAGLAGAWDAGRRFGRRFGPGYGMGYGMGYGPGMMGYGPGMMGYGPDVRGYGPGGYGPPMMGYGPGAYWR